jgi:hypothetical protein
MALRIEPELGGCLIVLIGRFTPQLFSPLWFTRNSLITEETGDAAKVEISLPDITILQLGKVRIQVESNRLSAQTSEAPWIDVCDLIVKTFTEALITTPIHQMGINRMVHFSVGSEETRNTIGSLLAPTDPWGTFGAAIAETKPPHRGGCVDVTMRLPTVGDGYRGHVQVSVQPSGRIKGDVGIYVQINDHYDVGKPEDVTDCKKIMTVLAEHFERSIEESDKLIDHVMSLRDRK